MTVNYGLIGYGRWGRNLARAAALSGGSLKWVMDMYVTDLMVESGIPVIRPTIVPTDLMALTDAVVIAAPTAMHMEMAFGFVECGKHVFVEKPFSLHYEPAKLLVERAHERGLVVAVGHEFIYHRGFQEIIFPLRDMGGLIDLTWLNDQPFDKKYHSVLRDLGPHPVSLLAWIRPIGWNVEFANLDLDMHLHEAVLSNDSGVPIRARVRVGYSSRFRKTRLAVVTSHFGTRSFDDASTSMLVPDETLIKELSGFFSKCERTTDHDFLAGGMHILSVEGMLFEMEKLSGDIVR